MAAAPGGTPTGRAKGWAWAKHINSHERFVHDSIDSLGYDWERVADPAIQPRYPLRVYLPQNTGDVVTVLTEAKALGIDLTIRAHGHSSNDLVVRDHGSILLTEKMNRVLTVDEAGLQATVQPGCQSADVDDLLAQRNLGLKVIGDHAHVTTGGFASVGGISASSFRHGLFVDTLDSLEYVTWDGEVRTCGRHERTDEFNRVLLSMGRHGVITKLTVNIERVDKYGTIWKNEQRHYKSMDEFLGSAIALLQDPPANARFMRGMWVDTGKLRLGQFSVYVPADPSMAAKLVNDASYGFLDGIGWVSGRLPRNVDRALKYVGMMGIVYSPVYATQKNAESFSDKILDSTVGDPTRYLVAIARQSSLDSLCHRLMALLLRFREEHDCFTVVTLYLKGIRSPYLAAGRPGDDRWAEVLFFVAMNPHRMSAPLLDRIVEEFDDVCIDEGAYRYMHSRTTKDLAKRRVLDPHTVYEEPSSEEVSHGT